MCEEYNFYDPYPEIYQKRSKQFGIVYQNFVYACAMAGTEEVMRVYSVDMLPEIQNLLVVNLQPPIERLKELVDNIKAIEVAQDSKLVKEVRVVRDHFRNLSRFHNKKI